MKVTEKSCLLELERVVRLALTYEADEDFIKQLRCTSQSAIKELNRIRALAEQRKAVTAADKYAKKMGIRR